MEELRSLLHDEYLHEVADLFDKFIEWCEIRSYPIDSISFKMFIHQFDKTSKSEKLLSIKEN
jgi:hypothetical protein